MAPLTAPGGRLLLRGAAARSGLPLRRERVRVRAAKSDEEERKQEARLEAFESAARRSKRADAPASASGRDAGEQQAPDTRWPEGQLLPDGWEGMDGAQKVTQLYMGERGFLFWATRLAWWSVIGLAGAWVVFRFVLPGLGLYDLQGGVPQP